jgi:hypothetical protein
MNFDLHKIAAGAASGFVAALLVDVHAWQNSGQDAKFDLGLAFKRWVGGAIAGTLMALGVSQ